MVSTNNTWWTICPFLCVLVYKMPQFVSAFFSNIVMVSINNMGWSLYIGYIQDSIIHNMMVSTKNRFGCSYCISVFCPYSDILNKQHMVVHLHCPGIKDGTIHISIFVHRLKVSKSIKSCISNHCRRTISVLIVETRTI